jgi:hypothetical protein
MMGRMDMPMGGSGATKGKGKGKGKEKEKEKGAMSPDMMAKCMKTARAPAKPGKDN